MPQNDILGSPAPSIAATASSNNSNILQHDAGTSLAYHTSYTSSIPQNESGDYFKRPEKPRRHTDQGTELQALNI